MMKFPQPSDGFEWVQASGGLRLVCRPLEGVGAHLFTTRAWRLGFPRPQAAGSCDEGWPDVALAMGVEPDSLVRLNQVHGSNVVLRRASNRRPDRPSALPEADIVMTDDSRIALVVQTADCAPLLIADSRSGVAAAAHAGWRGLAARVPGRTIRSFLEAFGGRPADLVAAIGPAIGACCYEVGEDVRASFAAASFGANELSRWFLAERRADPSNPSLAGLPSRARGGRWYFDMWAAARDQLVAAGVPSHRIHCAALCTASHADVFCSYRRDGVRAGRMAAAIKSSPRDPSRRSPDDRRGR